MEYRLRWKKWINRLGTAEDDWQNSEPTIRLALKKAAEAAISQQCDDEEIKNILKSTAERQLEYALSKLLILTHICLIALVCIELTSHTSHWIKNFNVILF